MASGKVSFQAGGMQMAAEAGAFVAVPRHTEHSFVVEEAAVLINFYFPAGFEMWLMGSAVPALRNEPPPKTLPPPPMALIKKLSDDYGGLPLTKERSTSANPVAPAVPRLTSRHTAEKFWFERGCWSVLADAASAGGSYSVLEVEMPQGLVDDPHIHDYTDEAYYVFDGEIEFLVDDKVFPLRPGSLVFVPRGSAHAFRVTSETARFLNIHITPGYELLLRAFGTRTGQAVLPSPDWRPNEVSSERIRGLHADLGLRSIVVPVGFQA